MQCAPLSMFGGPSRSGCDGVHFLVNRGWNSRDVSMAGMCDYLHNGRIHIEYFFFKLVVGYLGFLSDIMLIFETEFNK